MTPGACDVAGSVRLIPRKVLARSDNRPVSWRTRTRSTVHVQGGGELGGGDRGAELEHHHREGHAEFVQVARPAPSTTMAVATTAPSCTTAAATAAASSSTTSPSCTTAAPSASWAGRTTTIAAAATAAPRAAPS